MSCEGASLRPPPQKAPDLVKGQSYRGDEATHSMVYRVFYATTCLHAQDCVFFPLPRGLQQQQGLLEENFAPPSPHCDDDDDGGGGHGAHLLFVIRGDPIIVITIVTIEIPSLNHAVASPPAPATPQT